MEALNNICKYVDVSSGVTASTQFYSLFNTSVLFPGQSSAELQIHSSDLFAS